MADTLEEARNETQQARASINEARQNINVAEQGQESAQTQIEQAKKIISSEKFRRSQPGLAGLRNRSKLASSLTKSEQEFNKREKQIEEYKKQVEDYESKVSQAEAEIAANDPANPDYQQALKAYEENNALLLANPTQRRIYEKLKRNQGYYATQNYENITSQVPDLTISEKREIFRELNRGLGTIQSSKVESKINNILQAKWDKQQIEIPKVEVKTLSAPVQDGTLKSSMFGGEVVTAAEGSESQRKFKIKEAQEARGQLNTIEKGIFFTQQTGKNIVSTIVGLKDVPKAVYNLATKPEARESSKLQFKQTPSNIQGKIISNPTGAAAEFTSQLGIGLGAAKVAQVTLKGVKTISKLPKYETRFLSSSSVLDDSANILKTDSVAVTTEKNLLSNRNYLTQARTISQISNKAEDVVLVGSRTVGKTSEVVPELGTGRLNIKKPTKFSSVETGLARNVDDLNVLVGKYGGMTATTQQKGNIFSSVGRIAEVGKKGQILDKSKYVSASISIRGDKGYSLIYGKSVPYTVVKGKKVISKTGQQTIYGLDKIDDTTSIQMDTLGNQKPSSLQQLALKNAKQVQKKTIETNLAMKAAERTESQANILGLSVQATTKKPETILTSKPINDKSLFFKDQSLEQARPIQSQYTGTGQYERTNEIQLLGFNTATNQRQGQISITGFRQDVRPSQKTVNVFNTANVPTQKPLESMTPRERLFWKIKEVIRSDTQQRQAQRQTQQQAQALKQTPRSQSRFKIFGFGFGRTKETQNKNIVNIKPEKVLFFSKRKGKEVFLFEEVLASGLKKAKAFVNRNINASVFARTKEGKSLNLGKYADTTFRPGKRNPNILVEKNKFRLNVRDEVSTIQRAKKKKSLWRI